MYKYILTIMTACLALASGDTLSQPSFKETPAATGAEGDLRFIVVDGDPSDAFTDDDGLNLTLAQAKGLIDTASAYTPNPDGSVTITAPDGNTYTLGTPDIDATLTVDPVTFDYLWDADGDGVPDLTITGNTDDQTSDEVNNESNVVGADVTEALNNLLTALNAIPPDDDSALQAQIDAIQILLNNIDNSPNQLGQSSLTGMIHELREVRPLLDQNINVAPLNADYVSANTAFSTKSFTRLFGLPSQNGIQRGDGTFGFKFQGGVTLANSGSAITEEDHSKVFQEDLTNGDSTITLPDGITAGNMYLLSFVSTSGLKRVGSIVPTSGVLFNRGVKYFSSGSGSLIDTEIRAEGTIGASSTILAVSLGGDDWICYGWENSTKLKSGTNWRENHDGTVTMWGNAGSLAVIPAGSSFTGVVTFPVALSNNTYKVTMGVEATNGLDATAVFYNRTVNGFSYRILNKSGTDSVFLAPWQIEGGSL